MHTNLQQVSQAILVLPRYAKRGVVLVVDVSLCILTVWAAFYLRLGEVVSLSDRALWAVVISLALALPIFIMSGLYRAIFRYSGWPALFTITQAIGVYGLFYASIITAMSIPETPRTIGLIQPLLLFFAVGGSRALARYGFGYLYQEQLRVSEMPKALVYGAGRAGRQLISALDKRYGMQPVGFLDDDDDLHGQILNGQPIFAPDDLSSLIESKGVTHVLLALPSASRRRRNQIRKALELHSVTVRTLPSLTDLAEGRVTTSELRNLDMDEVMARTPVTPDQSLMAQNVLGKVVLVTGAGGSIGGELCRQIIALKPVKILLIETNEYALYSIHVALEEIQDISAPVPIIPLLASVQDKQRIGEIIATHQADTIYHAAAYKHVPLVEHNLAEGIRNNVIGTLNTVQIAIANKVSDFVLISTDKAVRPTNVMGASKRLAELCLQALFAHHAHSETTRLSMVRFGNVLGSSGSVIPKFRKQIEEGAPITLTHPEITRYFMSIPEAAQLVLQAGAMAKGGDVFVLDMGQPVKIADLARRMIALSGLTVCDQDNPDGDIEIKITGLRPGEKLYEELLLGDNPQPTDHPKIQRAQDAFIPWPELKTHLEVLENALSNNNIEVMLELLQKMVAGYQPDGSIVDWLYKPSSSA